jgi:AI-2 transport system substrate-binding protein
MRETLKKTAALSALLLALLLPLSCGGGEEAPKGAEKAGEAKELTVVFIPKLTGNAFFESASQGAQEYGARHGFKVDYRGSPQATVAAQLAVVERAIDDGVPAISISSLDKTALDEPLKRALAKGIVVTTWDSDVSGDARRIMVSQGTPSQLGRMLVEMGAKGLTKRGKNPTSSPIRYAWHYSQASVADQNSWHEAGEEYIRTSFPNWENVNPDNFYSEQDPDKALAVGREILELHPDIDLIICNDSTALPGQAEALKQMGKTSQDVTVTGFASPNSMKEYCREGIIDRWGLWDCQIQGAMACFISYYLASGNQLNVGQMVNIPEIGMLEVMPNTVLDPAMATAPNSGVVLLPQRTEFSLENMDDYDF